MENKNTESKKMNNYGLLKNQDLMMNDIYFKQNNKDEVIFIELFNTRCYSLFLVNRIY